MSGFSAGSPGTPASSNVANIGNGLSTAGTVFGITQGLQKGGAIGTAQAALGAGSLYNQTTNAGLGTQLGIGGGTLGIISGLQQGGAQGDIAATMGGLKVGAGLESMAGNTATAGALSDAAGGFAVPLALVNFGENWQSGKTGSDALNGAEAGATIGSVIPGVGTVIGAAAGALVGAASSALGPGATDPEQGSWGSFLNAYESGGQNAAAAEEAKAGVSGAGLVHMKPGMQGTDEYFAAANSKFLANAPAAQAASQAGAAQAVAGASGTQDWQALSGLFDMRSSDMPFYQQYGRMGEGQFMTDMTSKINDAVKSGQVSANATPQQIFQQVVNPWISGMNNKASSTGKGWSATGTGESGGDIGGQMTAPVEQLLTNLIGNYQQGQPMYNVGGDQANFGTYA